MLYKLDLTIMNEEQFWQIIQKVHIDGLGDMDKKCELVSLEISKLSAQDAKQFQILFDEQMDKAYSWELWGAAYVIAGGCSDDSFTDFRSALISRGEVSLNAALLNPDSLADQIIDEDDLFYEGYQYAVSDGVEKILGTSPERYASHPSDSSGNEWEEDENTLKRLYPKLWAKSEGQYDTESMSYTSAPQLPTNKKIALGSIVKVLRIVIFLGLVLIVFKQLNGN